jgi:hypothetical protein
MVLQGGEGALQDRWIAFRAHGKPVDLGGERRERLADPLGCRLVVALRLVFRQSSLTEEVSRKHTGETVGKELPDRG